MRRLTTPYYAERTDYPDERVISNTSYRTVGIVSNVGLSDYAGIYTGCYYRTAD